MLALLLFFFLVALLLVVDVVANLRSSYIQKDHSDKVAISKFTSKRCHKARTAQCNINLFTFSCLHEAFHFLWTKRARNCYELHCITTYTASRWYICAYALLAMDTWNVSVDTTMKTWLCQDYDINFDCVVFSFTLFASYVDIFSVQSDVKTVSFVLVSF